MARNFDGVSSVITGPVLVTVPFTVSTWFKTTNLTAGQVIFFVGNASANAHYLMFRGNTAGDPISATSNGSVGASAMSAGGVTSGVWHHGAGVWAAIADRRVFLNGAKNTNTTSVTTSAATGTAIGRFDVTVPSNYFDGQIAEVAAWNVALTDDEITSLSKGCSPLRIRPSQLVAYLPIIGRNSPETDVRGLTFTVNSATKSEDHPRIYR